jgi:uncharacterized membrane protein HdeD (DUF308 family)
MSKLDVGVGDEFPLDESRPEQDRHTWKQERARHWRHHHGRHHHHRRHGFGRLAFLLVIAGTVALIVQHQITRDVALGMIGAGISLMAIMFVVHAFWHRRHHRDAGQVS